MATDPTDVNPPPAEASSDEPSSQASGDTQTPASPPKTDAEQKNGKGPNSPLNVPKDKRSETEIGYGSRCSHPKGPREPPSEWT
ncbi:tyrosine-protein phosphatase non-receptor type 12 [Garra rufa]|uniref:tyrosine-protein phosphatase non-receptor type 12 n=1 Tax=Garra rufa TaxID=137080 RepID=UPI003CCED8AB